MQSSAHRPPQSHESNERSNIGKAFMVKVAGSGFLFCLFVFLFFGLSFFSWGWFNQFIVPGFQANVSGSEQQAQATKQNDSDVQAQTISQAVPVNIAPGQQSSPPAQPRSTVESRSAFAVEFGGTTMPKVLFAKDSLQKLPIASLTKLMTALVVLKHYDLNEMILVSKEAMAQEGEQGNLKEGEALSVKDLLYIALIESSNRAAFALSEHMGQDSFVALMNGEAKTLGLANTHFADSSGLSKDSVSSAQDVAKLSEYLYLNYPLFDEIIGTKKLDLYLPDGTFHHTLENTNGLLGTDAIVGGKTGYTYEAKGCLMAIQKESSGDYIVHVVLGSDDRFLDMKNLINKATQEKIP